MVYRRIDSATDEWTDGDVSHEAIVFRLTNQEVNQGIYALNEVEPQYYIACHTFPDIKHKKSDGYIGTIINSKFDSLKNALHNNKVTREILHRGNTDYCQRMEIKEKQKVDARNNPRYYDGNNGGGSGVLSEDKIIDNEKVTKFVDLLKARAKDETQKKSMPISEAKKLEEGQVRNIMPSDAPLREILNDLHGDTSKFSTMPIVYNYTIYDGNRRYRVSMDHPKATEFHYVEITEEEFSNLNKSEHHRVQLILNPVQKDVSVATSEDQQIDQLVTLYENTGTYDVFDEQWELLKTHCGYSGQAARGLIDRAKAAISDKTSRWIPEGMVHIDWTRKTKKEEFLKEEQLYDEEGNPTNKVFLLSAGQFGWEAIAKDMSDIYQQKEKDRRPYDHIVVGIYFKREDHFNVWHNSSGAAAPKNSSNMVRSGLKVHEFGYQELFGGKQPFRIHIKELQYYEKKTNNAIVEMAEKNT